MADRHNTEGMNQQVNVQWNNFQGSLAVHLDRMRRDESFCVVTLFCEETELKAHKLILSASSSVLEKMLKNNPCSHPILFMHNLSSDVEAILNFIYTGKDNFISIMISNC